MALGLLSHQVAKGHLAGFDQAVAGWLTVLRSPVLDGPVRMVSFFGSSLWTLLALGGLSLLLWKRRGAKGVTIMFGTLAISLALEVILRYSVRSWRPDAGGAAEGMDWFTRFRMAGYPSGHAFRAAFVFGWVIRELNGVKHLWARLGQLGGFAMIGAVGLTRVYLNRHWASDILGSWLVVLVVFGIARCWEQTGAETHLIISRHEEA